tara:strand:- start:1209 stop:1529 length:321 start_codon:yes stop_codon:yes gene_type:complete
MTNIIDFPTAEDTPITPEFLMEFCDDYQLETVKEFMSVFMRALDGVSIDDDDESPTPTYLENTIYPKLVVEFLEENDVRCDEDMEEFSQMINLLTAEPNVPLLVMN